MTLRELDNGWGIYRDEQMRIYMQNIHVGDREYLLTGDERVATSILYRKHGSFAQRFLYLIGVYPW